MIEKQYIHKKGFVATKLEGQGYYTYTRYPDSPGGLVIDPEIVENSSDWKEVKK